MEQSLLVRPTRRRGRAVFLSPHLDDVAFSCGGTLIALSRLKWFVALVTVFTASTPEPTPFALACQLDKGLPADVDYMKIRRREDRRFAFVSRTRFRLCLPYSEAPQRGYASRSALFGPVMAGDEAWQAVAATLDGWLERLRPDIVFAPQAVGGHVDHCHLVRAVLQLAGYLDRVWWYADVPYSVRPGSRSPLAESLPAPHRIAVDVTATLEAKIRAAAVYATQVEFQFGGSQRLATQLEAFARMQAASIGHAGPSAEAFRVVSPAAAGAAALGLAWSETPVS
jgi:LmbE family N-acetylglucosaminyl deacetylase